MNIIDVVVAVANGGLMVYTFMLFFSLFADKRLSRLPFLISVLFIISCFTLSLLFAPTTGINIFIMFSLTYALSRLYKIKWYNGILLSAVAYAIGMVSEFIVAALLSAIFSVDPSTVKNTSLYILGAIISKLITFVVIVFIRIKKQKNLYSGSTKKKIIIFLFPLSTIIVLSLQSYYFMLLPNFNSTSLLITFLCYAFLASSNFIVLDVLEHLYQDAEKENQLAFAQKLILSQEEQYKHLLSSNQNILKIRHDTRNFIIGLLSEMQQKRYDSVMGALQNQLNESSAPQNILPDGIISNVVNIKSQVANDLGISINFDHSYLNQIKISEIDLAIILGNALDNAIEATQQLTTNEKKIDLSVKVHNNQIIISIKNKVISHVDTKRLNTTKKNPEMHGFGLTSIKKLSGKYGGKVLISCSDNIFELHILLKNISLNDPN